MTPVTAKEPSIWSHRSSSTSWWNCWELLGRVFRSHRFKDVHVEMLYQRYFLRMNQSNLTSLLALLIVISLTCAGLMYAYVGEHSLVQAIIMAVFALVYLGLELLVTRSFLNEVYLIVFSYIIFCSFLGTQLLLALDAERKSALAGAWATVFFIYLTYTFLPLHIRESLICGTLLGLTQIVCVATTYPDNPVQWRQVTKLLREFKSFAQTGRLSHRTDIIQCGPVHLHEHRRRIHALPVRGGSAAGFHRDEAVH